MDRSPLDRSKFIAGIVGPFLIAVSAALLVNYDHIAELMDQFAKNWALVFLAGMMSLVAGLAIVRTHNRWTGGWPVLITALGWLAVAGGLVRMIFPRQMADLAVDFASHAQGVLLAAFVPLLTGIYLSAKAFR